MQSKFLLYSFVFFIFNLAAAPNSGQFFILTLPGFNNLSELEPWLEKTKPAGVMLVAGHVKNRNQTKKLCTFLQNKAKDLGIYPLLICIDWEGGIVSRPNETGGFNSIPSPHNLCVAGRTSCFLAGQLIGQQMHDVGINIDFAPSLDLFDPKNYVLATRCFSQDPNITAECGIAFANGLTSMGVMPVIKHYPGLMLGKTDTHFSTVKISASKQEFNHNEKPFIEAIKKNIPAIMVTHATYGQLDKIPASRSGIVIKRLKKYNPNLIVFTDDISMYAYSNGKSLLEAAHESIKNGFDLLIYSAPPEQQIDLIEKLNKLIKNMKPSTAAIKLKQQISKTTQATHLDEKQTALDLAQIALAKKIKHINLQNKNIQLISVDLTKIRTAETWFIQKNMSFLAQLINKSGFKYNELIFNAQEKTTQASMEKIINPEKIKSADVIILQTFFYGDGVWNESQKQLLKFLKPYEYKTIVFSLGHPFEQFIVSPTHVIELGSFQKPILNAVLNSLIAPSLLTGAGKLAQNPEKFLQGKRFGLLCHKCSVINQNNKTEFLPNFLYNWTKDSKNNAHLCALFAPEHGVFGTKEASAKIDSVTKSSWDCPIYSLHGSTKSPTAQMLKNLDLLIIDLQEVGVRCYTYLSTLALALQAAKNNNVPVLLLERPNPIKFWGARGPKLKSKFKSFVGMVDTSFIHGLTIGQIAKKLNASIGANLTVLPCEASQEVVDNHFTSNYIPPSPNLPTLDSVYTYPITVFIEGTNYSEGRGTLHPFEQIGAPWVDAKKLANTLNKKMFAGIYFEPISFTPKTIPGMAEKPKHKNKLCHGIFLHIINRNKVDPILTAQTILKELFMTYPKHSEWIKYEKRYFVDLLAGCDSMRLGTAIKSTI